jgi:hypothetical protein
LKSFKEHLSEGFVNLIQDDPKKSQYIDSVWNMIQRSYADIGGIRTNGFQNKEAMMQLPFWKVATVNGKPVAVTIYKDKGGRKSVASATDGSEEGKKKIADMMKNELSRSYGEKSKGALGLTLKITPPDVIKQFLISPKEVAKLSPDDEIVPVKGYKGDLPDDAKVTLSKYPFLKDYGYLKDFGGKMLFKVMLGTPGKSIK